MARSVRCKDRVDYNALNNLSSANFETASKGKRKYKPGVKLYQVERLVSKRKSSNKVSHIIMIILQSCKQWTADFMTSVFTCTLQYITFELPTLKCLAKFPKWLPKQRKKVPMRRALSIFFDLLWYIPGENLWRIFNDPTRSLWEPLKIFKILVKIDLQGYFILLPGSSRIFKVLVKIFKDLSFSCQDL